MTLEAFRPIARRLFIDVIEALLARQGGGKQHKVGVPDAIVHDGVGELRVDMLGDFQTHDKIVALVQVELAAEIGDQDQVGIDLEIGAIDGLEVDPEDLSASPALQHPEPGAGAAPKVEHGPKIEPALKDIRHHDRAAAGLGGETSVLLDRVRGIRFIHPASLRSSSSHRMPGTALDHFSSVTPLVAPTVVAPRVVANVRMCRTASSVS